MAFEIGSFIARFGIDMSEYSRGIINANGLNALFGQTFTTFIANPLLGSITTLRQVGGAFLDAAGQTLSYAEEIQRIAGQTGIAAESLQALRETLKQAGVDAGLAEAAMAKFADVLGTARAQGGPGADAIQRLGLSLGQVKEGDEGIRLVLERLASIDSVTTRAQIATDLFGRSAGPTLANAVRQSGGSVRGLVDQYERLGLVLGSQQIDRLASLDDAMGRFGQAAEGVKRTAIAAFLEGFAEVVGTGTEGVDRLADSLKNSLVPAAQEAGKWVGELIKSLEGFQRSDLIEGFKALGDAAVKMASAATAIANLTNNQSGRKDLNFGERNFPFLTSLFEQAGNLAYQGRLDTLERNKPWRRRPSE